MEFSFKQSSTGITAELTVKSGSATITEDVAVSEANNKWGIDKEVQHNIIDMAFTMNRADRGNDVDFVKYLYENWLNNEEQGEFLAKIGFE